MIVDWAAAMCDGFDDLQSDSETNEQWGRYDDIERAHLLCNDTADDGASRTKLRLECCGKVPAPPTPAKRRQLLTAVWDQTRYALRPSKIVIYFAQCKWQ